MSVGTDSAGVHREQGDGAGDMAAQKTTGLRAGGFNAEKSPARTEGLAQERDHSQEGVQAKDMEKKWQGKGAITSEQTVATVGGHIKPELPLFESEDGGIRSFDGKETYYMGIIDILQQYNGIKFVENFVMPLVRQEDAGTLSAVPPDAYARRFYEYIRENSC